MQAAGPGSSRHGALARRLDLAEADRFRGRPGQYGMAADRQLAGREGGGDGRVAGALPGGSGSTGPSFSRVPATVVHAPGSGVHARISRSMATAGRPQSTCASSGVILGAKLIPSSGCGTARSCPDSIPSRVPTSSAAPDTASRASRSPAVSRGPTASVTTPYTGPASSSLTMWNVVAPVTSSPCSRACCTGAAPRHAGSTEKCRLTQPCGGMSRADCGSSAPYAVTGQQSGPISRSRSRNAGSRTFAGVSTSMPASRASRATGLGSRWRPRPAGASGRVTTAATSCRDARMASRAGMAAWGVPAKTSRISGPVSADGRTGRERACGC